MCLLTIAVRFDWLGVCMLRLVKTRCPGCVPRNRVAVCHCPTCGWYSAEAAQYKLGQPPDMCLGGKLLKHGMLLVCSLSQQCSTCVQMPLLLHMALVNPCNVHGA